VLCIIVDNLITYWKPKLALIPFISMEAAHGVSGLINPYPSCEAPYHKSRIPLKTTPWPHRVFWFFGPLVPTAMKKPSSPLTRQGP